jgi:E3 ubiquitin-protein ligase UBR4
VLEQLANVVCPIQPEPEHMLVLKKSPTQEEYIRGAMTKNPYNSAELGATMRDVKNKICRSLDLRGCKCNRSMLLLLLLLLLSQNTDTLSDF